jgi:hypothetical protein
MPALLHGGADGVTGFLCVPAGSRWRAALGATLSVIERQLEDSGPAARLNSN